MALRSFILVVVMTFSVMLSAKEKQNYVNEFCDVLDSNGRVVDADTKILIKQICYHKADTVNAICCMYSITDNNVDQDGYTVTISNDKIAEVTAFCNKLKSDRFEEFKKIIAKLEEENEIAKDPYHGQSLVERVSLNAAKVPMLYRR
ncbi:MAG: hypothetical protein NTY22_00995 [Proteobacteria bacterium]|nr:hypothetical protein [Pseudomonadota bacterium]